MQDNERMGRTKRVRYTKETQVVLNIVNISEEMNDNLYDG